MFFYEDYVWHSRFFAVIVHCYSAKFFWNSIFSKSQEVKCQKIKQKRLLGQIFLNSDGNLKRLVRNVFEAYCDRWFKKRVSADVLSWYQSSKLGSSIIDFHSEKVLWHEKNDYSNFSISKILERPLKNELRMGARADFFS